MTSVIFAHDLLLDGVPYRARRLPNGARGSSVEFLPQVEGQQPTVQLEPANETTWHRGSGAGRKMLPGMNSWGKNAWMADPGYVTAGPLVTTVALPQALDGDVTAPFVEQDGHIYFAGGRYVTRIPNGSDPPVLEKDLGAGFQTRGMRLFKSSFYVGGVATGNLWEKPAGGTWTNALTGALGVQRGAMGSVFWTPTTTSLTREYLVAQSGTTGIQYVPSTNDPRKDTDWTPNPAASAINVGPYPITSLVGTRDHIYIATTGGLRDLDSSGNAPNLTPQAEALVMDTNGLATLADSGWIYYGAAYGLLRVRVANANEYAEIQNVTPKLGLPDDSPVFGLPLAIARYRESILLAQWDAQAGPGGTTYISWGRESLGGYGALAEKSYAGREIGPMVWNCSPIVLTGLKVTRMHVSGLVSGNPRLWMATTDANGVRGLAWAPLAVSTPYQDLRQGRAYQFCTSWEFTETYEDGGDDTLPKIAPDAAFEFENLGVGTSVAVSVAVDGSPAFAQIGTLNSSPQAKLVPQQEVRGNRFQLKYAGSGQTNAPPILRKRSLRLIPRPDLREIRHYQLVIGRAVRHTGGNLNGLDPVQQKARLAALQQGSTIALRDEDGQALQVLVAAGVQFTEVDMDAAGNGERVLAATLTCAVLATAGQSFGYDSGVAWDSGRSWS